MPHVGQGLAGPRSSAMTSSEQSPKTALEKQSAIATWKSCTLLHRRKDGGGAELGGVLVLLSKGEPAVCCNAAAMG